MINDNSYVSAIISEPVRIMGVELRPFSIGHYLLMKKYECNFVSDDPTQVTINDLVLAIAICARTYDGFLDFIRDTKCLKWIKKWGKEVNKELKGNPLYFVEREAMFREYLNNGMKFPKYWLLANDDSGGGSSNKLIEHIITTLQGKLGYTRAEVLNVPFTQAIYDYFLYLEQNGIIQLMSDEELELVKESENKDG